MAQPAQKVLGAQEDIEATLVLKETEDQWVYREFKAQKAIKATKAMSVQRGLPDTEVLKVYLVKMANEAHKANVVFQAKMVSMV